MVITARADSVNDEGTDRLDARECTGRAHGDLLYNGDLCRVQVSQQINEAEGIK